MPHFLLFDSSASPEPNEACEIAVDCWDETKGRAGVDDTAAVVDVKLSAAIGCDSGDGGVAFDLESVAAIKTVLSGEDVAQF